MIVMVSMLLFPRNKSFLYCANALYGVWSFLNSLMNLSLQSSDTEQYVIASAELMLWLWVYSKYNSKGKVDLYWLVNESFFLFVVCKLSPEREKDSFAGQHVFFPGCRSLPGWRPGPEWDWASFKWCRLTECWHLRTPLKITFFPFPGASPLNLLNDVPDFSHSLVKKFSMSSFMSTLTLHLSLNWASPMIFESLIETKSITNISYSFGRTGSRILMNSCFSVSWCFDTNLKGQSLILCML